jgi:hypothetical protein
MKTLNFLLSGLVLISMGCGSKQNPMDGKPDAVKDGRLPAQKVEAPKPERSDIIRINTVNKFTFVEGREDKFMILSTVLASDYENQLEISNEIDFPGSKFDQTTGEFLWTPPKGYVFDGLSKTVELRLRVFAKNPNNDSAKIFTMERSVEITVEKSMSVPALTVTGLPDAFVEGEFYTFEVTIHDEDAGPAQETFPRLVISNPEYQTISLAPFIKVTKITPDFVKRDFVYTLSVDTNHAQLTDGMSSAGFSLKAISRYDVRSTVTQVTNNVVASFGEPKASWVNKLTIEAGKKFNYSFLIFENTSRADFEVTQPNELPPGAEISCDDTGSKGIMPCTLTWDVPADQALGDGTLTLSVKALKRYHSEVKPATSEITLEYEIIESTNPTPTPPPVEEEEEP